jgi:hypothetical protein
MYWNAHQAAKQEVNAQPFCFHKITEFVFALFQVLPYQFVIVAMLINAHGHRQAQQI